MPRRRLRPRRWKSGHGVVLPTTAVAIEVTIAVTTDRRRIGQFKIALHRIGHRRRRARCLRLRRTRNRQTTIDRCLKIHGKTINRTVNRTISADIADGVDGVGVAVVPAHKGTVGLRQMLARLDRKYSNRSFVS